MRSRGIRLWSISEDMYLERLHEQLTAGLQILKKGGGNSSVFRLVKH